MADIQGQSFSWSVITHVHKERSVDWYWAAALLALVAAGISVWLSNFLFALIIIVGAGSIGALLMRGPREHAVHIDARGISVDGTMHPYRSLESFWVDEHEQDPRLYLTTAAIFAPHMMLPLESRAQAAQVRSFLKRVLQEKEQGTHFGEHVAEMLGL